MARQKNYDEEIERLRAVKRTEKRKINMKVSGVSVKKLAKLKALK